MATEGHITGWSLSTVLQMVEMDKRTCTLRIQSGENVGLLYFRDGSLINAESGPLRGIDAAYEIVNWEEASIEVDGACRAAGTTIDLPVTRLLLEGLTRGDENRRDDLGRAREFEAAARDIEFAFAETTAEDLSALFDSLSQKEVPVSKLQEALDQFRQEVPEFVSTDIVSVDSGLSIGGATNDPEFDASVAAASYSEVVKSNQRALDLLGLGGESTEDILITTVKNYILIRILGGEYYHLVAIARRGNLGLARAIMKKYEPRLLQAVGQLA
jgi:predicted regulator of Ras-like GTPase activity (Roadblock/LC7/MglB family)